MKTHHTKSTEHNGEVQREKNHSSECTQNETGESIYQQLDSTSKSSITNKSKYTPKEQREGNNQTQG